MRDRVLNGVLPYALLALFVVVSAWIRPLLPIDETRYLGVAWEMLVQKQYLLPTLNFEPYFQKPPLLFWLIDLTWNIFGVSRAAALLIIYVASSAVLFLTTQLARALFSDNARLIEATPWIVLGSLAFALYSTLILFDMLLTALVLAAFLSLLRYARTGRWRFAVAAGLFIGLGLLAKGPVVIVHVGCPALLYGIWRDPQRDLPWRSFFKGVGVALLVATVLPLIWLVPLVQRVGWQFVHDLVWNQAAGRVTGTISGAHSRPVYFYLLLLPLLLLPWGLSRNFWQSRPWAAWYGPSVNEGDRRSIRLLTLWFLLVFAIFSAIAGKQPHYLVPAVPPLLLVIGYFLSGMRAVQIRKTAVATLAVVCLVQAVAFRTHFARYDLAPMAEFVSTRPNADWAIVGSRYQGEITFLARLSGPLQVVAKSDAEAWLEVHPKGFLLIQTKGADAPPGEVVFSQQSSSGVFLAVRKARHGHKDRMIGPDPQSTRGGLQVRALGSSSER